MFNQCEKKSKFVACNIFFNMERTLYKDFTGTYFEISNTELIMNKTNVLQCSTSAPTTGPSTQGRTYSLLSVTNKPNTLPQNALHTRTTHGYFWSNCIDIKRYPS